MCDKKHQIAELNRSPDKRTDCIIPRSTHKDHATFETGISSIEPVRYLVSKPTEHHKEITLPEDAILGISLIDKDHQKVFDLLQKVRTGEFSEKQFLGALEILEDYVLNHFRREEDLMLLIQYPRYEEHIAQHKNFVRMMEDVWNKTDEPNSELVQNFVRFIQDWWNNHIEVEDRKYSEWLRSELNAHYH